VITTHVLNHLQDLIIGPKESEIVIAMIRIIIGNVFQGFQAAIETIEKQLHPNLPFSPNPKPVPLIVCSCKKTSSMRQIKTAKQIKNKPSLYD